MSTKFKVAHPIWKSPLVVAALHMDRPLADIKSTPQSCHTARYSDRGSIRAPAGSPGHCIPIENDHPHPTSNYTDFFQFVATSPDITQRALIETLFHLEILTLRPNPRGFDRRLGIHTVINHVDHGLQRRRKDPRGSG